VIKISRHVSVSGLAVDGTRRNVASSPAIREEDDDVDEWSEEKNLMASRRCYDDIGITFHKWEKKCEMPPFETTEIF
jgi:hypothetical protein